MDAAEVFNALPAAGLAEQLRACCAAPAWGAAIIAKRPYRGRSEIIEAADAAARALTWDEVVVALSAHPRIGERASGDSAEASWSRQEQSTAARSADELTKAALADANRAY